MCRQNINLVTGLSFTHAREYCIFSVESYFFLYSNLILLIILCMKVLGDNRKDFFLTGFYEGCAFVRNLFEKNLKGRIAAIMYTQLYTFLMYNQ